MYKHKTSHDVQQVFLRATRGAERYKFAVERYNVVKYKNSPYYKGSELWYALPRDTIDSTHFTEFKRNLMNGFRTYQPVGYRFLNCITNVFSIIWKRDYVN